MREIKFRVWHKKENKMYFRGYQKLFHVLLCRDDCRSNAGRGIPVKKVSYEDCELLEGTGISDKSGKEIFEGDRVRVKSQGKSFAGTVDAVPDMFKSRGLHPLESILKPLGLSGDEEDLEIEILGNRYETSQENGPG